MLLLVYFEDERGHIVAIHSERKVFDLLKILGIPPERWDEYDFYTRHESLRNRIFNPIEAPVGLFRDRTIEMYPTYADEDDDSIDSTP
jgi:hypothetical protein